MDFLLRFGQFTNEKINIDDIKIDVSNINRELIDMLINGLSFIGRKRKPKSLRIKSIKGFFHDDKHVEHKDKLEIITGLNDKIIAKFTSDGDENDVYIKINDDVVYDMGWSGFNEKTFIEKIIDSYKDYLKKSKWKL